MEAAAAVVAEVRYRSGWTVPHTFPSGGGGGGGGDNGAAFSLTGDSGGPSVGWRSCGFSHNSSAAAMLLRSDGSPARHVLWHHSPSSSSCCATYSSTRRCAEAKDQGG